MTWTEVRSGASTAARQMAHDDRAKDRRDETSRSSGPRPRPRWLWPVVAGALLVLVAGTGAVALASRDEDPPPQRQAGAEPSPAGGGTQSPAAATGGEPLSGDLTAVGTVTSTSSLGTRWAFPLTLRLECTDSCQVTVVKAPAQYRTAARAYTQRTFLPAGGGVYRVVLDEPLSRSGGQISPGCGALRVKGSGTLVRQGDSVTISIQHGRDQFPGPNGNQCALVDRTFAFTGTLS